MAGHSKWANIKHKKARMDAKKGKIFSKIAKEIIAAAREGGGNPDNNLRLRLAIEKARANDVPNENIERAIKRGTGELEGVELEETVYEGYGPGGVAVMLEILTDNRNRTAAEIRHIFSKNGGNLGESGCVAWMFVKKGLIRVEVERSGLDEDQMLEVALEAGAEDMTMEDDVYEITTDPQDLASVHQEFVDRGIPVDAAEVTMIPKSTVTVDGEEARKVLKLMDALEEHDDVQNVYANFDIPDEVLASLEQ